MFNWFKKLFKKDSKPSINIEFCDEEVYVTPVEATRYKQDNIGQFQWNSELNSDYLTLSNNNLTIEWDVEKGDKERPPAWIPASTDIMLHSGKFSLDFIVDEMADAQIGIGFLLQLSDGQNIAGDWGFFGYLGSSPSAWAYDPSTGDVVCSTRSIEGNLPVFKNRHNGTINIVFNIPREQEGSATFSVNGTMSSPIQLPKGAVVLPACCFLHSGQKVTLANFSKLEN